jgi:hypothetical protein
VGTLVSTPGALLALMEADVTPLSLDAPRQWRFR